MLGKIIDGLFLGTYYLSWSMGVLGLVGSIILGVLNVSLGLPSILIFVSTFALSLAVSVGLMPKEVEELGCIPWQLVRKKMTIVFVSLIIAIVIAGGVYFINGGFPPLNLIFLKI